MRYLIVHQHEGKQQAFFTHWYDYENNYNADSKMIVFDFVNMSFTTNGIDWDVIQYDNL